MIALFFDDGAPCAVKAARTVRGGGKSGDYFKGLPIVKSVYPAGLAPPGWHTFFLYLGGNESSTHDYVTRLLDKESIDLNSYNKSSGRGGSYSTTYQTTGRELLTPGEVRMLDNRYALLFIRGERPVMDEKFDILRHPNVHLTPDGKGERFQHGEASGSLGRIELVRDMKRNELLALPELEVGDVTLELYSEADLEELILNKEKE